jgi:hypothetical protein
MSYSEESCYANHVNELESSNIFIINSIHMSKEKSLSSEILQQKRPKYTQILRTNLLYLIRKYATP